MRKQSSPEQCHHSRHGVHCAAHTKQTETSEQEHQARRQRNGVLCLQPECQSPSCLPHRNINCIRAFMSHAPTVMSGRDARMKRRMSCTVWLWLKRATMRDPSASRSCRLVVGADSFTPAHSPSLAAGAAAAAALVDAPSPPRVRPEPVNAAYLRVVVTRERLYYQHSQLFVLQLQPTPLSTCPLPAIWCPILALPDHATWQPRAFPTTYRTR